MQLFAGFGCALYSLLSGFAPPEGAAIPNATTGSCPSASFCGSDMRAAYYGNGSLTGTGQSVGLFECAMKKAGYTVESFKPEGGERSYRLCGAPHNR